MMMLHIKVTFSEMLTLKIAPEAASAAASCELIRTGCEWQVKIRTVETGRVLCV